MDASPSGNAYDAFSMRTVMANAAHQPPHKARKSSASSTTTTTVLEGTYDQSLGEHLNISFAKGPKRKRLTKACDACHKSKRRCDGHSLCSNCFHASKICTYTDASGNSVPPPRTGSTKPASTDIIAKALTQSSPAPYQNFGASSSKVTLDKAVNSELSKRFKSDRGQAIVPPEIPQKPPTPTVDLLYDGSGLDHSLVRELVNLFFTHRQPHRVVLHKPSFSAALSHNKVPAYLVYAVCALAAPMSKNQHIRTDPARFAGEQFAQGAVSLMYGSSKGHHLICSKRLEAAQALILLQFHQHIVSPSQDTKYQDAALELLNSLGIHDAAYDVPVQTPYSSTTMIQASIERECLRRVFWLVHFVALMASIYFKAPMPPQGKDLRLRLPCDETSFEMGVHSTSAEYIYEKAPPTAYASELGHLIRIVELFARVEFKLDETRTSGDSQWVPSLDVAVEAWEETLADHLRFSENSLQVQLSMFETSSNSGAWNFYCMHVLHASCLMALHFAKYRGSKGRVDKTPLDIAMARIDMIMKILGNRAKYSLILGCVIWTVIKYYNKNDPRVAGWSEDQYEIWGIKQVETLGLERWKPGEEPKRLPIRRPTLQLPQKPLDIMNPVRDWHLGNSIGSMGIGDHPSHQDARPPNPRAHSDLDALRGQPSPTHRQYPTEQAPVLPSLLDSGLLGYRGPSETRPIQTQARASSSWKYPPRPRPEVNSAPRQHLESAAEFTIPPPSGLPVGMPWLANE